MKILKAQTPEDRSTLVNTNHGRSDLEKWEKVRTTRGCGTFRDQMGSTIVYLENQIMKFARTSAVAFLFGLVGATAAYADECSGRDHTTGTVLGAAGGAAIGGVASHNAGGAIAGAVIGGLAGNAIARSEDCTPAADYRRDVRNQADNYYGRDFAVSPDENDYWGVESYNDFGQDYRHISMSIDRARENGSLRENEARRFSRRLQQIQYRADWQERHRRFDPQDIESQLGQLREDMRSARRDNREEQDTQYRDRR